MSIYHDYVELTLDGEDVIPDSDNFFEIDVTDGTKTIYAKDRAGHITTFTVELQAEHSFEYVSNDDATCTTDGTKTGTCTHCGETEIVTDEGSMLEHTYGEPVHEETDEYDKYTYTCTKCGHIREEIVPKDDDEDDEDDEDDDVPDTSDSSQIFGYMICLVAGSGLLLLSKKRRA